MGPFAIKEFERSPMDGISWIFHPVLIEFSLELEKSNVLMLFSFFDFLTERKSVLNLF